jgi:ribonuclease D
VWQRLSERLEELDRLEWAREEFARLTVNATGETADGPVVAEKWRKLRGLGTLDRRRLAVVRELHAWREETAARTNRPARSICRDDLIVEIARRNPQRPRDLQVIRGLPHRDLEAVMRTVDRGRALPLEHCPRVAEREQDPNQLGWVANILAAVLGDLCVRWRLAPNLVATSNDIKLLVRARLQSNGDDALPAESLLTQGWRSRHILPELLAVLDGRRSVRVADVRAEAPLQVNDAGPM